LIFSCYEQPLQITLLNEPMMRKYSIAIAFVCLFFLQAQAVNYSWTGAGNKNFNSSANWFPIGVPTSIDDVVFPISDDVIFTTDQLVNSMKILGAGTVVRFTCNQINPTTSFSSPRRIQITNPGTLNDAFVIDAGAKLTVVTTNSSGTCYLTLSMSGNAGVKGYIDGELELGGASNSLSRVNFETGTGVVAYARIIVNGVITCQPGASNMNWGAFGGAACLTFNPGAKCIWNKDGGSVGAPNFLAGSWIIITGGVATGFSFSAPTASYTRNANVEINSPGMGSNFLAAVNLRGISVDTLKITSTGLGDVRYSTGTITAPTIDTIRGSLLIAAAGKLDCGASSVNTAVDKIVVRGDLNNAGQIIKTGTAIDTIEFASPTVFQTLTNTGTFNTNLVGIKINTRDSVVLASNFTANNSLNLTKGWIVSKDASLLTIKSTATVINYSDISFVIGPVKNTTDAYTGFIYPVGYLITGNTGLKRPLEIYVFSGTITNEYKSQYYRISPYLLDAQVNAPLDHVSSLEYWGMTKLGGSGTFLIRLSWYDPNSGGVTDPANLRVAGKTPLQTGWDDYGNTGYSLIGAGGIVLGSRVIDGSTAGNPYFTLASLTTGNPLPNESLLLTSNALREQVQLNWSVSDLPQQVRFELQESFDGTHYRSITSVGSIVGVNQYQQTLARNKVNTQYSVVMHFANGSKKISNPVTVKPETKAQDFLVYYHASTQSLQITLAQAPAANAQLLIFDMGGKLLYAKNVSGAQTIIATQQWSSGCYQAVLLEGKTSRAVSFIK
jgi:hypothetical protein